MDSPQTFTKRILFLSESLGPHSLFKELGPLACTEDGVLLYEHPPSNCHGNPSMIGLLSESTKTPMLVL